MSRKTRTNFAAPLVVTLAALPGCVVRSGPAPAAGSGDGAPTTIVSNPPRVTEPAAGAVAPPTPAPPPREGTPTDQVQQAPTPRLTTWTVFRNRTDQQCYAAIDVACSPKATCNPPPPQALDECPAGMTMDQPLKIQETSPGVCALVFPKPAACGDNPTCDPPRSRPVACP